MALGVLDWVLLVISLMASLAIGIYHSIAGKNSTPTEYMLGGRAISPAPLAMSLMVGTISAITIMGNPGEMYVHGTQLWMMDIGMVAGIMVVAKVFIPVFYPLNMISLYQYIEDRFGSVWLRRAAVLMQIASAYLFMGFLLYPPSIFLEHSTHLPMIANIFIIGVSCTLYSAFGGVKAVIYADAFQLWVMFAGVLAIIIQGSNNVGGIGEVWDICYHRGRIEFLNFDFNPYQRQSFWLVITFGFFFNLNVFGVTQNQTQRTFSTGSVKDAQKVMYYAAFGLVILRGLIQFSGLVVFANFADCDPLSINARKSPGKSTEVVAIYVIRKLIEIPGFAGLFVASIYAAVLSSVSTQVNSLTALVWEDFLKNLAVFKDWEDVKVTKMQKCLVCVAGAIGILMSLLASRFASFLQGLFQIAGAISGPMLGLFLVALLLPWVKLTGASVGLVASILISGWILLGQMLTQHEPEFLPMSHTACPSLAPNITAFAAPNSTTLDQQTENPMDYLYGLSYCLNFCWGSITCIIVALLVTLCTGSNTPQTVRQDLIYEPVWRVFAYGSVPKSDCDESKLKNTFKRLFTKRKTKSSPLPEVEKEESVDLNKEEVQFESNPV